LPTLSERTGLEGTTRDSMRAEALVERATDRSIAFWPTAWRFTALTSFTLHYSNNHGIARIPQEVSEDCVR